MLHSELHPSEQTVDHVATNSEPHPGLIDVHHAFNTGLGDPRTQSAKRIQPAGLDLLPCHRATQPKNMKNETSQNMVNMKHATHDDDYI